MRLPFYPLLTLLPFLSANDLPERGPVILTNANIDRVLKQSEIVFVSFVAEWCHFSRLLTPVWEDSAKELSKIYGVDKLTLGVVQTDKGGADLGQKYNINKYPTMKLFRSGVVSKKEYRGARSSDAFAEYIQDQLRTKITVFENLPQLDNGAPHLNVPKLSRDDRNVIGFFENKESTQFKSFEALAGNLKDDCKFWAGVGPGIAEERISGDNIVFKPEGANSADQVFMGDISNNELLSFSFVREITFTNGEELTEEGKPFLILFHKKEDTASLDTYKRVAENDLAPTQRDKLTILHADCDQFAHPLWHLGKSTNSCPIIAIDSFKHMYTFNNYDDIHTEGKLLQFCEDLHSGKLHREFHNGPDKVEPAQIEDKTGQGNDDEKINVPEIDPKNLKVETKVKEKLGDYRHRTVLCPINTIRYEIFVNNPLPRVEVQKVEPGQDPNKAPVKVTEEKVLVDKESGNIISTTLPPAAGFKKVEKKIPESQFVKLKPSELKYSIPDKDEL